MAKKDKKKKDKRGSDAVDAVEAVRSAVERTFQATTEGAAGTQKRTRALVDEVTHAAARIKETIEDLRVLEDVRGLRREIELLARRVAALESRPPVVEHKAAPATATRKRAARAKPAASKRRAKTTARRKPAARSKTRAKAKPSSGSSTTAKAKRSSGSSTTAKAKRSSGSSTTAKAKPSSGSSAAS